MRISLDQTALPPVETVTFRPAFTDSLPAEVDYILADGPDDAIDAWATALGAKVEINASTDAHFSAIASVEREIDGLRITVYQMRPAHARTAVAR